MMRCIPRCILLAGFFAIAIVFVGAGFVENVAFVIFDVFAEVAGLRLATVFLERVEERGFLEGMDRILALPDLASP